MDDEEFDKLKNDPVEFVKFLEGYEAGKFPFVLAEYQKEILRSMMVKRNDVVLPRGGIGSYAMASMQAWSWATMMWQTNKSYEEWEMEQKEIAMQNARKMTTELICRWYNQLNGLEWPEELPGKPRNWDEMPTSFALDDPRRKTTVNKVDYLRPIMNGLQLIVGRKETLRWHWLNNIRETNENFEAFWEANWETGQE